MSNNVSVNELEDWQGKEHIDAPGADPKSQLAAVAEVAADPERNLAKVLLPFRIIRKVVGVANADAGHQKAKG